MHETLAAVQADSFVVHVGWWSDCDGRPVFWQEIMDIYSQAAAPVFTVAERMVTCGAVGGKCVSPFKQGCQAGMLARDILDGQLPQSLPVVADPDKTTAYLFNYTMLKRFEITVSSLPEGATVLNAPETVFEISRRLWQTVWASVLALLVAVCMLFGLVCYRQRVYRLVRCSEQKYRSLVETTSDWIWELDADGISTFNSPQAEGVIGYRPEELAGRPPFDFITPEDVSRVRAIFHECVRTKMPIRALAVTVTHKDGRQVVIEANGVPILDEKGRLAGYRGVNREITERVRMEQALRGREAEMQSIFRASPIGIGLVSRRVMLRVNDQLCEMTGYRRDELVGQSSRMLYFTDEDFDFVGREKYRQIQEKGTGTVEVSWRRKDGSRSEVLLSSTPLDVSDLSKGVTFTALDITARKRVEQQLKDSKAYLESIINSAPTGIAVLKDRIIQSANQQFCDILSYRREELVGQSIRIIYQDEAAFEDAGRNIYDQMRRDGVCHYETRFIDKNGRSGYGLVRGTPIDPQDWSKGITFTVLDVTDRVLAEQQIQENQAYLYSVLNTAPAGIVVLTDRIIRDVNDQYCDMFGYTRDELIGQSIRLVYPGDREYEQTGRAVYSQIRETGRGRCETRMQAKDGRVLDILITGEPIDPSDWSKGVTFALLDISDRKRYETVIGEFLQTVASRTGTEMFEAFARQIGTELKADVTLIGQILPGPPEQIQTLAVYHDGDPIENLQYDLAGTPCEQVFQNDRGLLTYIEDVAKRYPDNVFLKDHGLNGYVGMPLKSQDGRRLGVICTFYRRPQVPTVFDEAVLQVFGNQAVMELQRLSSQAELETLLEQLRSRNMELDQVRATLETSLEQSPVGILIADAPDVTIRFANAAALMVRGQTTVPLTDIAYKQHTKNWQTYYPDGRPYPPEQLPLSRAVLKGEITRNEKVVIVQEDGHRRWIIANAAPIRDKDGRVVAGIVVFSDITEQTAVQQALADSEQKHRLLFSSANDAILLMDMDRFLECNLKALELYGCRMEEELLGKSPIDFSPEYQEDGQRSVEKAHHLLQQVMAGLPQRFAWIHQKLNGEIFYAEVALNCLQLEGRRLIQAVVRDVTEHRMAEKARERLLKELRSKNEELESIVYIASHDLRSPLVNIRGFSGELEKSLEEVHRLLKDESLREPVRQRLTHLFESDIPESLGFIDAGNRKLDTLLNGLLKLSRIGAAHLTVTRLEMNPIFEAIVQNFSYHLREEQAVVEIAPDLPACLGDQVLISQVFTNLIGNAIKYRHPERKARIQVTAEAGDQTVVYAVSDNGMGISPDHIEKVFEIFHRLNPAGDQDGEGLGLTIVRRILDRQDGLIWIESPEPVGTTVFVELPGIREMQGA